MAGGSSERAAAIALDGARLGAGGLDALREPAGATEVRVDDDDARAGERRRGLVLGRDVVEQPHAAGRALVEREVLELA